MVPLENPPGSSRAPSSDSCRAGTPPTWGHQFESYGKTMRRVWIFITVHSGFLWYFDVIFQKWRLIPHHIFFVDTDFDTTVVSIILRRPGSSELEKESLSTPNAPGRTAPVGTTIKPPVSVGSRRTPLGSKPREEPRTAFLSHVFDFHGVGRRIIEA